jgi:hypothetical protein
MPTTAEQLYKEALSLPLEARADLTERLVATLAEEIPSEITRAQFDEVHRRIGQVDSGEVALIPGDEALARVRTILADHQARAEKCMTSYGFHPDVRSSCETMKFSPRWTWTQTAALSALRWCSRPNSELNNGLANRVQRWYCHAPLSTEPGAHQPNARIAQRDPTSPLEPAASTSEPLCCF